MYDSKGRFVLHKLAADEANVKLCRVKSKNLGSRAAHGANPFESGRAASIPYITTEDARTIRYPNPDININDTIKFDLSTGKILEYHKFELGNVAMVIRGNNVGRVGIIVSRERHQASYDIIHLKDRNGHDITTRLANVYAFYSYLKIIFRFVIGTGSTPSITLPKNKGLKLSILEERDKRIAAEKKKA